MDRGKEAVLGSEVECLSHLGCGDDWGWVVWEFKYDLDISRLISTHTHSDM